MSAYQELERRFGRVAALNDAAGILDWDSQTMMPEGAVEGRADQLATLKTLAHELVTDPRVGGWLASAAADPSLDAWQRANLREMKRNHLHATAVPGDLVEAASKAGTRGEMVWRKARAASDFSLLRPALTEVLDRQREIGQAKAAALGGEPYDALLDTYEPGCRAARLDGLFAQLETALPSLLARVLEAQRQRPAVRPLEGPFAAGTQAALGRTLMEAAGFDFQRGRLDVSLHPFCGGATSDVRITTRYDETDFASALMGVLHETGHALYEQGRPAAWLGQPVGDPRGMATHESQSLLLEMQACRSPEFLTWAASLAREAFHGSGPAWDADNLVRHYTVVRPGFIRVDADEVTYPAHVILRYRLERDLVSRRLDVKDLPDAFNAGFTRLLGITPPDDQHGCLQDIHWPNGLVGYFPTYTLGAMAAAQLFAAARAQVPELMPALGRGDFRPLLGWLRVHVHGQASFPASLDELLTAATGRPLDPTVYVRHLETRYVG